MGSNNLSGRAKFCERFLHKNFWLMEPEDDYATWLCLVCSTTNDFEQFKVFIPSLNRLIKSIIETGSLPSGIAEQTSNFINKLPYEIVQKLLYLREVDISSIGGFLDFFKHILLLGKYGAASLNYNMLSCIGEIFKKDYPIYSSQANKTMTPIYEQLLSFAKENEVLETINNLLLSKPEEMNLIIICTNIGFYTLEDDMDIWKLSDVTSAAILNVIKSKIRSGNTNSIIQISSTIKSKIISISAPINPDFIVQWFDIFRQMTNCDIFEKQLAALKEIQAYLWDDKFCNFSVDYFKEPEHMDIFNVKTIHPELAYYYGLILAKLAPENLVTNSLIENLWNLHSVQYTSDLSKFLTIFCKLGAYLPKKQLMFLVNLVLKPNEETEQWVRFLANLGLNIGNRTDGKEGFQPIRAKLLEISKIEGPFQEIAKEELPSIMHFHLNSEEFTSLVDDTTKDGLSIFVCKLMKNSVITYSFTDKEKANVLMGKSFDLLASIDSVEDKDIVLNFISCLMSFNRLVMTNEQLDILFKGCIKCPSFNNCITPLINIDAMSMDHLESLLRSIPSPELDESVLSTIISYFYHVNSIIVLRDLTSMPFIKEELLWDIGCIESQVQNRCLGFICQLYTANDGVIITDYKMISIFIQQWKKQYGLTNNKSAMLIILRYFITTIEAQIDIEIFGVKRHLIYGTKNKIKLNITVDQKQQSFEISETTTIPVLKMRIAHMFNIPANSIMMFCGGSIAVDSQTVRQFVGKRESADIRTSTIEPNKRIPMQHQRTCVPSIIISQNSEVTNVLTNLLKEGEEQAKYLLDLLPTMPQIILKIQEIKKKKTYDYSELLPREYPSVFLYNLEALDDLFDDELCEHFNRTKGFLYLIETIPVKSCLKLLLNIVPFIEKKLTNPMKIALGQKIFDTIINYLPELIEESSMHYYSSLCDLITSFYLIDGFKVAVNESIRNIMKVLLFDEHSFVRTEAESVFNLLEIPLAYFTDLMDGMNHDYEVEFYKSVLPHVKEPSSMLFEAIKDGMLNESMSLPALLEILDSLLEQDFIKEPEDKAWLTSFIIDRYLVVDNVTRDPECFLLSMKCLSKLQNEMLLSRLIQLHSGRSAYTEWHINGDSTVVSNSGHCGLVNLGATCFLNSTLQQFYAIPKLRNAIIEYNGNDEFMCQLRMLFTRMYLSNGEACSTEELVKKWVGWDGEPMDPRFQQDACEFIQMLIDKLEGGLTPQFIADFFAGTTQEKIEGINEKFEGASNQPFTTFTLPIDGLNDTDEAFVQYQSPDFLTGNNQYYADSIEKKIDAKKVSYLGKLPKYLIIQLSRFQYNFQTWTRTKINSHFEFPTVLDISKISTEPNPPKYHLHGIVMHIGTAEFGHYISYIKSRDQEGVWHNFNDTNVSTMTEEEVLKAAYGEKGSMNGYILFYDREDVTYDEPVPKIAMSIQNEIRKANRLQYEYQLFCSKAYFEFNRILAASKNIGFVQIAIQYYFDTLPFTQYINRANEIAPIICTQLQKSPQLRDSFVHYIITGPFSCALVYCPSKYVRDGAVNMIETISPENIPTPVLNNIFLLIRDIVPYYRVWDPTFCLLANILSHSKEALNFANQQMWGFHLFNMIRTGIPNFIRSDNSTESHFFSQVDFTGIFLILSQVKCPPSLMSYVLEENFIKNCLISLTKVYSIVTLYKSLPDQDYVAQTIRQFAEKSAIHVNYGVILSILFLYFEEDAFELISRCRFLVNDSQPHAATNADQSMTIAHIIQTTTCHKMFYANLNRWLINNLLDENPNCRLGACYSIAYLSPNPVFAEMRTFGTNVNDNLTLDKMKEAQETDETKQRASHITQFLIFNLDLVIFKVLEFYKAKQGQNISFDSYIATEYIDILERLNKITQIDIAEPLIKLAKAIQPVMQNYDMHLKRITTTLTNINAHVEHDFILSFFPNVTEIPTNLVARAYYMFEACNKYMMEIEPPDDFVMNFLKLFAFPTLSLMRIMFKIYKPYLERYAKIKKDIVMKYLKDNLDTCANSFFSSVIIVLETANEKLHILPYLASAASMSQFLNTNELIIKSFAYNKGEFTDVLPLVSLLNTPVLSEEARKLIWDLIITISPPFDDFIKNFSYKGDWELLTKYLMIEKNIKAKDLLVQAGQNSIEAFDLAYEFLEEFAKDEISNSMYSESVLTKDLRGHSHTIVNYIEFLIKDMNDEEQIKHVIEPIIINLMSHVRFLNDILEDVADDAIVASDITPMFGALEVISKIQIGTSDIIQELGVLKYNCTKDDVVSRFHLPEFEELVNLLKIVILV